jgi:bacterioferritin-associated ferredoxin
VGAAIAGGASTIDEITAACAAGADCGACHVSLRELLAAHGRRPACFASSDVAGFRQ